MTDAPSVHGVLALLAGVQQRGDSEWWALCPCHDDHNPSLKISVSEAGKTLVKCWAGCSQEALVDRLFRSGTATATPAFSPAAPSKQKPAKAPKAYATSKGAQNAAVSIWGEPSARWYYEDADGATDLIVYRWDKPEGKTFRQISCEGREWRLCGPEHPCPLYMLQEVFRSSVVYVCEGEKAADAACNIGLTATTSAGGSAAWRKTDWSPLAGKRVIILPDNDKPGQKYASEVAAHLATLDPRPQVRVVDLPGLPAGGDIVEWLDLQGDAVEPDELLKRIEALAVEKPKARPFGYLTSEELADGDFRVEYLIDNLLVRGQPGIIAGPGKSLKTNLSIDLVIALATGGWFLQKFKSNRPVRVGLISGESGRATIQETARRVAGSKGMELRDITKAIWAFDLPTLGDAGSEAKLEQFIRDHQLEVLIVDPTYLALAVGDDAGNLFKMGGLLKGLSRIAQETGCTPILVHHFRKAQNIGETPELTWMAWAGLSEWARQWLLLNRRTAYKPDNGGSHKLWLCSGGSAGHAGMWGVDIEEGTPASDGGRFWDVSVLNPSEAKSSSTTADEATREDRLEATRQRKLERDLAAVLKVLRKFPEGQTVSKVGQSAGMDSKRYWPAIELGREQGSITNCEITKGRSKYEAIKLRSDDSDDSDSVRLSESSGEGPISSPRRGAIGPSDHRTLALEAAE